MIKKLLSFSLIIFISKVYAAKELNLHEAPLDSIKQFSLKMQSTNASHRATTALTLGKNTLHQLNQTKEHSKTITRYQQFYRGIPVVGAQVMISKEDEQVNGRLLDNIELNTQPVISKEQSIGLAKNAWFQFNSRMATAEEKSELQIRANQENELQLVYQVSFKTMQRANKPAWPFFIVDAHNGEIIKQWDNIKNFQDIGPGGNEKVHEYWYGKEGLPFLDVTQNDSQCIMETNQVKLVNLNSVWDWNDFLIAPFQYTCSNNREENINGAFSPTNDAYYFGHTIVNMYKEWYGINALQHANGTPMQLVMRVHFGQNYDNAFWDGQFMSFGDGEDFYPLVALDVAGHEVTHGFTEQHSGLEYHDQSGALNESISDMAGQASRAYLLEKFPLLYNKLNLEPDTVTWGIGETVVRDSFGKALRFMDFPSSDGSSADCLDKDLARSNGAYCAISYPELVAYAESHIANPQVRQNYIVHTASGVFNKAFYLLAKNLEIKKAYELMITANSKYWTPTTDFTSGACGVLYAAKDLQVDQQIVRSVFAQVGVNTTSCKME